IHELANALSAAVGAVETADAGPDLRFAAREAAEALVLLFAPMMPHLAEECWAALGLPGLACEAPWPAFDPALAVAATVTLPVQVNGRRRAEIEVAREAANDDVEAAALAHPDVARALDGKPPRKVIVVPGRIVNVVA
ncbi:MAG: class I tRNA ligase family protein, partial [Hyphomicrobiales bacterium]|nr:class I tRNA ligase family protein [Hyphomicrobiales bacterium]